MEPLTPEQQERLAEVRRLRYEGIEAAKNQQNDKAETLYRAALNLHEQVLGAANPDISESLGQLIYFCARYGRTAETKALTERALALLRQKPRPEHRGILRTLDGLASHYHERGRFEEAEWYYKRVLAAREELLGPNHPRVAATLERYASLLREMGRRAEAEAMEKRAKAMRGR